MFYRPMRRGDRAITNDETRIVLDTAPFITVATVDVDGAPYSVPLSFVRREGTLYIHATNESGHKFDDFRRDARICASAVIDVVPRFEGGEFKTSYTSAMVFGRIREVDDEVEFKRALVDLCMKYVPEAKHEISGAIERERALTSVWAIDIDNLSGKAQPSMG